MNCILVDDEPLAREGLENMLAKVASVKLTKSFSNALDANHFLSNNQVDLIFLDIEMASMNGLDFAKSLVTKPLIIFITAYPQYALDSFEVDAVDYLVKPIRVERLLKAINKAGSYLSLLQQKAKDDEVTIGDDYVFVKADRKFVKLFFHEILFIEGLKDYVIIHVENSKVLTAMNIKTILARLPGKLFARVSKSFIVNTSHISSADSNAVYIKDEEIAIGDNYREAFFKDFIERKTIKR